jgi:hypothetical protein
MGDILVAQRGHIIKSEDKRIVIANLNPSISGEGEILVVSNVSIRRNQVTQYVKTLDDKTFGYAWGEGVGAILVSGYIFLMECASATGEGVANIDKYYDKNNVYKKGGPCTLSIGGVSWLGYLEKESLDLQMTQFNFGQFSLEFSIIKTAS